MPNPKIRVIRVILTRSGGGGVSSDATFVLHSSGDVTRTEEFTPDNSGIRQVDVNNVTMLTIWSCGNADSSGNLYIGDSLPAGFTDLSSPSQDNVAIGFSALANATTDSSQNLAIGTGALLNLTSGVENVGIGYHAGQSIQDGNNNVVIGQGADILDPTGSQIFILGSQIDSDVGVTQNVFAIGYNLTVYADNCGVLGNENVTDVIFGAVDPIQTSGLLIVGKQYRISLYIADDDFTNVGASSNETGVVFTATGTTPTTWDNGSRIARLYPDGLAILHGKGDAIAFPDADPHVDGAAYWDSGVLVRSTG